jgi:hypothetical protein
VSTKPGAGHITVPVDKATGAFGTAYVGNQWSIKSAKGKPVSTSMFVNKEHAGISALIASSTDRSEEPILPLDVVHNNFATVPVPRGLFGAKSDEWVPSPDGNGGLDVTKIEPKPQAMVEFGAGPQ